MARSHFESLLAADFLATAHISLPALVDVLRNAMLQGVFSSRLVDQVAHPADDAHPDGWTETSTLVLRPPTVEVLPVEGEPDPIPSDLRVADASGAQVPLVDPDPPADREEQDLLLLVEAPFTLVSNNASLAFLGVSSVEGSMRLRLRPWWSPSVGIGLRRYRMEVSVTSTDPEVNDLLHPLIALALHTAFYPRIVDLLGHARLSLPDVGGLPVRAVRIFAHLDAQRPVTLSLGLGGLGTASALLPLLDEGDGLMITVAAGLFDSKVAALTARYPDKSYNWNEDRWETVQEVQLSLAAGAVALFTRITVHGRGLIPDATISIEGPLRFHLVGSGLDSLPEALGGALDVDLPAWLYFARSVTDIVSFGFAEIGWGDFFSEKEQDARSGAAAAVGTALSSALLGSYPSGMELFGRDRLMTRESAVLWSGLSVFTLRKEGLMMGGAAIGGIRHTPRALQVVAVNRSSGKLRALRFAQGFELSKDRAVALWMDGRLWIPGLELRRRGSTWYLRDRPDGSERGNLGSLPTFAASPHYAADDFDPLATRKRYAFVDSTLNQV